MATHRRSALVLVTVGIAAVFAWSPDGFAAEQQGPDRPTSKTQTNHDDATDANRMTLAEIARVGNGFDRNALLYEFVADADRWRIEGLLADVSDVPSTPYRGDIPRVLYIRYASLDPEAAANHALRALAEPDVLSAVFRVWAHADLDSAVARAAELPTGARADAARAILQLDLPVAERESIAQRLGVQLSVAEVATPDPPTPGEAYDAVLARLGAIGDRDSRWKEQTMLSSHWATADPAGALAAIIGWDGDANLKGSMLFQVMNKWAMADPRTATVWLLANDSSELPDLVFRVFAALARVDLAEAKSLAAMLPLESSRRQAQVGVFLAILDQGDLERAATAFAELDVRDQPLARLAARARLGIRAVQEQFEALFDNATQV